MKELIPIEHKEIRVLLTSQLAEAYETTEQVITNNFNRNKERYQKGKHYYLLEGEELKEFKSTTNQIELSSARINKLYLWTERGALLHAKSLNTDKAWTMYDILIDTYFHVKELEENNITPADPEETKRKVLECKLRFFNLIQPIWDAAGVSKKYQALALSDLSDEFGIHVPRIALQGIKFVWDKTMIADKLGLFSKTGKPHALAVGAIIEQIPIEDDEVEYTPYYRHGHAGVDAQYTDTVVDKVEGWLLDNNRPNQIINQKGRKINIYYR